MTKHDKPTRDRIALDVLLTLLRSDGDSTLTPEDVGVFCRVAYAFADGLSIESVRPAEGEEIDASYTVLDTDEGPAIEDVLADIAKTVPDAEWDKLPHDLSENLDDHLYGGVEPDTESKAARTKRIGAEALEIYAAYPRKDNSVKAKLSIEKVLAGTSKLKPWPFVDLLRRTRQYAEENPPVRRSHPDYKTEHPHPSTWFNQRRFEDEQFDEGTPEIVETNRFLTEDDDAR